MVPVLSKMTVSTLCVSKCSPPLNKIPNSAARPDPAIIDVGVAKPKRTRAGNHKNGYQFFKRFSEVSWRHPNTKLKM